VQILEILTDASTSNRPETASIPYIKGIHPLSILFPKMTRSRSLMVL
jgi:hypothetical protein